MVKSRNNYNFSLCSIHNTPCTHWCSDCKNSICNACHKDHYGHLTDKILHHVLKLTSPWRNLLNQLNRCVTNLQSGVLDSITIQSDLKTNLQKAIAKCNRMIRSGDEGDVAELLSNQERVQKYTDKSVGQYKLAMKIKRRERDKNRKLKNRVNTGIFTAPSSEPEP